MSKAHKHAEVIKAWADGAEIEVMTLHNGWHIDTAPAWSERCEYRVKPEKLYPVTQMSGADLHGVYMATNEGGRHADMTAVANAALRHAIDAGQVVAADEHKAEIADLHDKWVAQIAEMNGKREARDMAVAEAVREKCIETLMYNIANMPATQNSRMQKIDLAAVIASVKP